MATWTDGDRKEAILQALEKAAHWLAHGGDKYEGLFNIIDGVITEVKKK